MTDPAYEAFVLYRAYRELMEELLPGADALNTTPGDLVGQIAVFGEYRAACLLVAKYIANSVGGAAVIVAEVRAMCEQGIRPRFLMEMELDR